MSLIKGHHHVSMYTKDAQVNKRFYTETLGLRLVKQTVNQDNPTMYHLFYGDATGAPGTELSFFELPRAGHTVVGTNRIARIGLRVASHESLLYWKERFEKLAVTHSDISNDGKALQFEDSEGLTFVLIVTEKPIRWQAWEQSPVPTEHQIRGIHAIAVEVKHPDRFATFLEAVLDYCESGHQGNGKLYQSFFEAKVGDITVYQREGRMQKPGKGSIHHLALTVADETSLARINQRLLDLGYDTSGIIDRHFFKSVYVRERNGILIELATDGPGLIAADAPMIGSEIELPPFLEPERARIEKSLIRLD